MRFLYLLLPFFLFKEAVERIAEPQDVGAGIVMVLGGLSILLNWLSMLLLKKGAKDNMNMRAAYLHLLSDMISSVAVVLGGLAMYLWEMPWVDSVISIVIALYLVYSSWGLMKESVRILMQFAPLHVNLDDIHEKIQELDGVENMHHVHVWQLDDKQTNFEAHISFKQDLKLSEVNLILHQLEHILQNKFKINHVTLQPELNGSCEDESIVIQEKGHTHYFIF